MIKMTALEKMLGVLDWFPLLGLFDTDATSPRVATAEGSDKIPNEIVSAIMTLDGA